MIFLWNNSYIWAWSIKPFTVGRIRTTALGCSAHLLLGILQFVVFREAAGFNQLKADAPRLNGVDELQHRQAAADLLVLNNRAANTHQHVLTSKPQILKAESLELQFQSKLFTLKLEILVDFPASAKVWFTHFTMMSSLTFSPSPSSSRTFNVYLKAWRNRNCVRNRKWPSKESQLESTAFHLNKNPFLLNSRKFRLVF